MNNQIKMHVCASLPEKDSKNLQEVFFFNGVQSNGLFLPDDQRSSDRLSTELFILSGHYSHHTDQGPVARGRISWLLDLRQMYV